MGGGMGWRHSPAAGPHSSPDSLAGPWASATTHMWLRGWLRHLAPPEPAAEATCREACCPSEREAGEARACSAPEPPEQQEGSSWCRALWLLLKGAL